MVMNQKDVVKDQQTRNSTGERCNEPDTVSDVEVLGAINAEIGLEFLDHVRKPQLLSIIINIT